MTVRDIDPFIWLLVIASAMRLIQVRVADDTRESVLDALDDANADYVIADEAAGNDASIVYFPTPAGAVKEMLDNLTEAGLADDQYLTKLVS